MRWKKAALENCPGIPCITNTVPGAPTGVVATAGVASVSVAFTAPSSTGGSSITGYTVTSSPGGITATGASLSINVTGLTNGTAYTFSVVATNAVGNSVASAASTAETPAAAFTPCSSPIIDADGNSYTIVTIGTQCWTKENLRVRKYNDGTAIPFNTSGGTAGNVSSTWNALAIGAYTLYAHDSTATTGNLAIYGYLYNWYASKGIVTTGSTTYKNICPTGYHVPTDSDWNKLVKFIDSGADTSSTSSTQSTTAGTKLKKNDALWTTNTGTDDYGFTALPGGFRNSDGSFYVVRDIAFFWSASEGDGTSAWNRFLNNYVGFFGNVNRNGSNKSVGASVRCLRD